MEYLKEIIHYFKDSDIGIGLDLEPDSKTAVIFSDNRQIDKLFTTVSNNVTFVTENIKPYEQLLSKYPSLNLVEGNILNTNLNDNSIDFIIVDSGIINLDRKAARNELKRISSAEGYCNVVIIDEAPHKSITDEFLEFFYAGSWYELKEFNSGNHQIIRIYHNPIGFNEDELKVKEITEFVEACEDFCNVLENYNKYSVKDFLYNIQKTLVNYYLKGFDLPNCNGSDNPNLTRFSLYAKNDTITKFLKVSLTQLEDFIGKHSMYWSNYNPYPDDKDNKNPFNQSVALDLHDMYDDIKSNLIIFNSNDIYNQQEAVWNFKFGWHDHTGNHWTFAVRAIHWKLQDLRYED